jgi:hypothetical protein
MGGNRGLLKPETVELPEMSGHNPTYHLLQFL